MGFDIINFALMIINLLLFVLGYAIMMKAIRLSVFNKRLLNDTQKLLMLYSNRRRKQ